jgi:hypothetical protein
MPHRNAIKNVCQNIEAQYLAHRGYIVLDLENKLPREKF